MNVQIPDFLDRTARVVSNQNVGTRLFVMRLEQPEIALLARPAQFVQILSDEGGAPYLRRPFSFLRANPNEGWFEIYYDVIGPGTSRLEDARAGDQISILGPLGCAYVPPEAPLLLVAGGVGVVPLAFLAWAHPTRLPSMTMLFGANTRDRLPDPTDLVPDGLALHLATDDGSAGHAGFVTDLIASHLAPGATILTCGPHPMMARVAEIAATLSVPCFVSLENHMACGFGACVGCVVEYREADCDDDRYRRVCLEGPVVDAHTIVW